ncbi:response regulator [Bradyrhizobium sp. Pa8]|uniref:response regulator n=1 Tax=Bradyrhizobium sp. Pa8 TaxID=3386552 RepID=UPI00403F5C7D
MNVREGTALIRIETAEMHVPTGHVLFIDGVPGIRRSLTSFFAVHDMPVRAVPDWRKGGQDFETSNPSLIVLDLPLRADDRLRPFRDIQSRSDVPVIVTIDHKCDGSDRVLPLEMGADDYLTKPLSMRGLLAAFARCSGEGKSEE